MNFVTEIEVPILWTLIGDTVNNASRIEGLCKDFSTDLIFSDA